jgi:hypothetical protein
VSSDSKGKVCPVVNERCHYLACLGRVGCIRTDGEGAPAFVPPWREPAPKEVKHG